MRSLLMAGLAIGLCTGATAAFAGTHVLTIQAGENLGLSVARAQAIAHARKLHAAFLRSGRSAVPGATLAITGGKGVVTTTVAVNKAPAAPATQFTYTAPNGFGAAEFVYQEPNTGQTLVQFWQYPLNQTGSPTSGTITIEQPNSNAGFGGTIASFSPWAAAGSWPIAQAYLLDATGAVASYTQTQVAALFTNPAVTVTNTKPDKTAPTISKGAVVTPTVSASAANAAFIASLTTADNKGGSGVDLPLVFITPPGGTTPQYSADFLSAPIPSGTVQAVTYLGSGATTGAWTISGYGACDTAGNCLIDQTAADVQKLFGTTTFTVTP